MALVIGKTTIKRKIEFDAEGDLGAKVPTSFVIIVERPSKPVGKKFSILFAKFADVLAKSGDKDVKLSAEQFTNDVDAAEQKLSDFVKDKISGWETVQDVEGEALAFSEANLDLLFSDKEARKAVFEDYQSLVTGRKKESEKNSENSAKDGS